MNKIHCHLLIQMYRIIQMIILIVEAILIARSYLIYLRVYKIIKGLILEDNM